MHVLFFPERLLKRGHLEALGVNGFITFKCTYRLLYGKPRMGFMWLRTRKSDGLL